MVELVKITPKPVTPPATFALTGLSETQVLQLMRLIGVVMSAAPSELGEVYSALAATVPDEWEMYNYRIKAKISGAKSSYDGSGEVTGRVQALWLELAEGVKLA